MVKESEETEVKNIEELKSWFKDDKLYVGGYVKCKIDQLDKLRVLSREWMDKYVVHVRGLGDVIEAEAVENLLVPKQELPVIPQFVADLIENRKGNRTLYSALDELNIKLLKESRWQEWNEKRFDHNGHGDAQELIARAWLDGFTVEEQKFYALIKGHENIGSDDKYWNYCITDEGLDIGDNKVHADVLAEYVLSATKDEWENLGINDDNADFVEVEELEK